ncbi:hypothetical protein BV22DRAFT_1153995 [Leucogyrophana mollusca]|uniref:Uncharacterized protein n=1 Tax=Leucogyrophana mollusca TaxID=85980 RepID=A0ACB8BN30_9AGAM|nr:hypothetical protein BV22DRAFT_1153995 [Leucogyrophana mollusca]
MKKCRESFERREGSWSKNKAFRLQHRRPKSNPWPLDPGPIASHTDIEMRIMSPSLPPDDTNPSRLEVDDIKTEFHPHAEIPAKIDHFVDFRRERAQKHATPPDREPWKPFRTRIDFEVAELAHEVAMSKDQTNRLIGILRRCARGDERFTIKNHTDIRETWGAASHSLTPFTKDVVSVPFRGENMNYDIHYRPLWDWACDLLRNPQVGPHFVFDAQRLSKYNGTSFVRFYDEPWTANAFWDAQSRLPSGGKPFAFILYADKAKLSSFGREKGYPVVARCANLPVEIRNGNGVGGGRVVGWLPIVKEDKAHAGKTAFVNFKNAVWHESFKKILESIAPHSKTGFWFECLDGIVRLFFPLILILSADYEEQCVMALIRGLRSNYPCPVCLIPREELSSMTRTYPLRTSADTQALIRSVREQERAEDKETMLKSQALRDVDSAFDIVANTDVYRATSFDRLHAHGGLFADHLWAEFQRLVEAEGRDAVVKIDTNYEALPRWRNLNHFDQVMSISFTDGTKNEDIAKLLVFAAHDVFTVSQNNLGHILLQCIRAFVDVDMYAALEVHTEETIAAGLEALKIFSELMEGAKLWNFIKKHSNSHLFDDIIFKGVTRNYTTKMNEKMHGPLKDSYLLRTNFKNVAGQILQADHCSLVAEYIRAQLDILDDYNASKDDDEELDNMDEVSHIRLGARQDPQSLAAVEDLHKSDVAFKDFRIKLAEYLNNALPRNNIPLPNGRRIKFTPTDTVTEFRYLRVNYESKVDWRLTTDHLRCSPSFYNAPRYDCVIYQVDNNQFAFARLIFLFECSIANTTYPTALIHAYNAPIGQRPRKDKDLGLWRIRTRRRADAEFISVKSIIRGAAVAEDKTTPGDFFVIDTIDTDTFLRMKEMRRSAGF